MMESSTSRGSAGSPRNRARLERRQAIADYVLDRGVATPQELTEITGVSLMTVHRDLDELASRGLLRKFHGGVAATSSLVFESSSDYRLNVQPAAKRALAAAAMRRIEAGMSVMLDTSSTNVYLARLIAARDDLELTIVTNYVPILQELSGSDAARVIMIGGEFNRHYRAFLGMDAVTMTESLRVDVAILSTSAMTTEETFHQDEALVTIKRAMLASSDHSVLLTDRTKIGRVALHRLAPVRDFGEVMVAAARSDEVVSSIAEHAPTTLVPTQHPAHERDAS